MNQSIQGLSRLRLTISTGLIAALAVAGLALFTACGTRPQDVLTDSEGELIRLEAIDAILENDNLSNSEKRQQLQDLGIEDEALIDALFRGRTG